MSSLVAGREAELATLTGACDLGLDRLERPQLAKQALERGRVKRLARAADVVRRREPMRAGSAFVRDMRVAWSYGVAAVRTAIFDFDGTVADTIEQNVLVLNELASEFGYRNADAAEVQVLRGLPPREIAERLGLAWNKVPIVVARARSELAKRMSHVRPCRGVPEALRALRARGITLGLLTSNTQRNVDLFLARHPLELDFVSTGSGMWSKHRRLVSLLRQRGLAKEEAAYVGDEIRDIEAGKKAGVRTVAVGWGYTKAELLAEHAPDHIVLEAAQLVTVLC